MIAFVLSVLALLSSVRGLCYSPVLRGFAPDVILPSVLSSEIRCPPPHVFDYFVCMCVDASVVKVRVPTEGRTSLSLSRLNKPRVPSNPPFRLASPIVGLPDMHVPGTVRRWPAVTSLQLTPSRPSLAGRVVPVLNPYGSFNMPVKAKLVKEAGQVQVPEVPLANPKEQELLDKVRWRKQLEREAAAVAAVELAAAASASAVPVSPAVSVGQSTLDLLMRDTLRRILYGY
ncbi:uncharacterized protein LOC143279341 [Babylonia areolata]|uniref:uncharacterized protein LOC143279341 n=1 Tax=Babylonia areolata TaxID=304850 RepID=UPI003FCF629C